MSPRRLSLLVALLLIGFTGGGRAQELQTFDKSSLTIDTASGPQKFAIELALTPAQQAQGLMYRKKLAPDAGMLFDFVNTAGRAFWMKNTLIPLDMLFIAANGRIADIHERAVPLSEAIIPSRAPVRAVLELNGGTVARLGIKIGDVVHDPIFGNGGG
jgi:uncharacterized protein